MLIIYCDGKHVDIERRTGFVDVTPDTKYDSTTSERNRQMGDTMGSALLNTNRQDNNFLT